MMGRTADVLKACQILRNALLHTFVMLYGNAIQFYPGLERHAWNQDVAWFRQNLSETNTRATHLQIYELASTLDKFRLHLAEFHEYISDDMNECLTDFVYDLRVSAPCTCVLWLDSMGQVYGWSLR